MARFFVLDDYDFFDPEVTGAASFLAISAPAHDAGFGQGFKDIAACDPPWTLPDELLACVVSHLGSVDKHAARLTNKAWRTAVNGTIHRLSGNMYRLTDGHLRTAGSFSHATSLDLSQCAVKDLAPLSRLFRLRSLECNWCTRLEPASLQALSGLSQLTKLDLSGCAKAATDEGLHILACRSDSLEWLSLQCCPRFRARGLSHVAKFGRLRYLDMSETGLRSVRCLAACTALVTLRLSGCARLQDGALAGLAALPNLAALDLRRSRQLLTDDTMRELCALSGLRTLDLEGAEDITNEKLAHLTRLQRLTRLILVDCPQILNLGISMPHHCSVYIGSC